MEKLMERALVPGRELDPGLLGWLRQFDAERERWLEEACNIENKIGTACRRMGLTGSLQLFGSVTSGFGSSTSDVDLVFVTTEGPGPGLVEPLDALKRLQAYLRDAEACYNLTTIFQPRSPLLKLTDLSGIEVDLMVDNYLGVRNTELLRAYHDFGDEEGTTGRARIDIMVRAVKEWARRCGLVGTIDGLINSYAWTLMAIYFLQVVEVLPNFQLRAAENQEDSVIIEGHETRFSVPDKVIIPEGSASKATAGALIWGFFQFYAFTFDWKSSAVSLRLAKPAPSYVRKADLPLGHRFPWYIEDPFDTGMNLARGTTTLGRERILGALRGAAQQLLMRPDWRTICPPGFDRPFTQLFLKLRLQDPVSQEDVPSAVWSLLRPRQPIRLFMRVNEPQVVEVFAQFQTWQDMRSTQSSNEKKLSCCEQPVALYVSLGYSLWEDLEHFVVINPECEQVPAGDLRPELSRVFLPLPFGPGPASGPGPRLGGNPRGVSLIDPGPPGLPAGPPPKAAPLGVPKQSTPPRSMNPMAKSFVPSLCQAGGGKGTYGTGLGKFGPRPSFLGGMRPVGAPPSGATYPIPACGSNYAATSFGPEGMMAIAAKYAVPGQEVLTGTPLRRRPAGAPPGNSFIRPGFKGSHGVSSGPCPQRSNMWQHNGKGLPVQPTGAYPPGELPSEDGQVAEEGARSGEVDEEENTKVNSGKDTSASTDSATKQTAAVPSEDVAAVEDPPQSTTLPGDADAGRPSTVLSPAEIGLETAVSEGTQELEAKPPEAADNSTDSLRPSIHTDTPLTTSNPDGELPQLEPVEPPISLVPTDTTITNSNPPLIEPTEPPSTEPPPDTAITVEPIANKPPGLAPPSMEAEEAREGTPETNEQTTANEPPGLDPPTTEVKLASEAIETEQKAAASSVAEEMMAPEGLFASGVAATGAEGGAASEEAARGAATSPTPTRPASYTLKAPMPAPKASKAPAKATSKATSAPTFTIQNPVPAPKRVAAPDSATVAAKFAKSPPGSQQTALAPMIGTAPQFAGPRNPGMVNPPHSRFRGYVGEPALRQAMEPLVRRYSNTGSITPTVPPDSQYRKAAVGSRGSAYNNSGCSTPSNPSYNYSGHNIPGAYGHHNNNCNSWGYSSAFSGPGPHAPGAKASSSVESHVGYGANNPGHVQAGAIGSSVHGPTQPAPRRQQRQQQQQQHHHRQQQAGSGAGDNMKKAIFKFGLPAPPPPLESSQPHLQDMSSTTFAHPKPSSGTRNHNEKYWERIEL